MLIFGLCSTSDDRLSDPSNESQPKCEKRPPSKSLKNEILIFGLHPTSDDQLSDQNDESRPICDKRPPKSSKNEMLIFGLCSTSDDWPLYWSIYRCRLRLQDRLHSGDEFPIAFKVNYISEDLLPVMVTSHFNCNQNDKLIVYQISE